MYIETKTGEHRSVASQGLGVWGAVGGGLGTLAFLRQGGFGNILGGADATTGAVAVADTREICDLRSQLATCRAEQSTDAKILELYNVVANNKEEAGKQIAENAVQIALNKQASEFQYVILNNKIDDVNKTLNNKIDCSVENLFSYVNSNFIMAEKVLPANKICGDVTACGTGFCTTGTSCTVPMAVQTVK